MERRPSTRERLKQQRKQGKSGAILLVIGIVIGVALGWSGAGGTVGMTPQWAYTLIAFGLGGVFTLLCRWAIDSRRRSDTDQPLRQG